MTNHSRLLSIDDIPDQCQVFHRPSINTKYLVSPIYCPMDGAQLVQCVFLSIVLDQDNRRDSLQESKYRECPTEIGTVGSYDKYTNYVG